MSNLETRSLALLFLGTTVSYSLLGGLIYLGRIFSNPACRLPSQQSEAD
jgi:hypothetical protein